MALLEVKNLEVYYGVIQAIKGISFEVNKGEIVTLIGANGAGKTTTMQSIIGLIHARSGEITYNGQLISGMPAHKIVHLGMTQVPEGRRIFSELTVYENLMMGAYTKKDKEKIKENLDEIYALFPRLEERKNQVAGTLSGGEQQMLAMGRAMMSNPDLLMLDEPSMGLSPLLVDQVFDIIKHFHEKGTTILLVEQNANKSLAISDRAYVLENGRIVLSGTGAELLASEEIKKAYLGG
ncbi:MAG: ABC transporter ATP-binding protein [Clostridia bacterium]|nr:ABC transporter ATP-binding protein [Clostridia bacterium]MBQ8566467.1 ABC transporter ATP-binding protein [Clostridia bacterium]